MRQISEPINMQIYDTLMFTSEQTKFNTFQREPNSKEERKKENAFKAE